jgi:hypothetical protein
MVAQLTPNPLTGVILEDLARTATIAARVHIRCAPDPSQALDDPIMSWEKIQTEPLSARR